MYRSVSYWGKMVLAIFLSMSSFNITFSQKAEDDSLKTIILPDKEISAATTINFKDFNTGNIQNPIQLIQGKISGFSVSKAGGDPNAAFDIRLRGLGTLICSSEPLIIIDGMPGSSMLNIDVNDIESIKVIKDGSAAFYGIRASNGVIIITTKHGEKGKLKIGYNGYTSVEMVAKSLPSMNIDQWKDLSKETGLGTDYNSSTVWIQEITKPSKAIVQNLNLSGGTDKTFYRASFNYRNVPGVLINTSFTQINGRLSFTQKAFHDKLSLDLNLGATERNSKIGFSEAFSYAAIANPTSPVKSTDPVYSVYGGYVQQDVFDYYNPVSILEHNKNEVKDRILNAGSNLKFEIFKGLSANIYYSIQKDVTTTGLYYDKKELFEGLRGNGYASKQMINNSIIQFESTISYVRNINSISNISVLAGYSDEGFKDNGYHAQGYNFLSDNYGIDNLEGATYYLKTDIYNKRGYKAYFGNINLTVNDLLFIYGNARYEESKFPEIDDKWNLYPSAGAGFNIARLINPNTSDKLKFRVSYGIMGNQFITTSGDRTNNDPEKRAEFDAGLDFATADSRLSGSIDYYSSISTNLIMLSELRPLYGNYMNMNKSKLSSSGLELTLKYNLINKSDFSYTVSFNSSWLIENTIRSLSILKNGTLYKFDNLEIGNMGLPYQYLIPMIRLETGRPVGQIFTRVFKEIDATGTMIFVDANNDGFSDREDVGNGIPKLNLGFGNSISYKNWDLNFFFRGVFGHDLVNSFRSQYEVPYMISSYNLPATATDMRAQNGKLMVETSGILSSKDVENASFVSLDNICLGYKFNFNESSFINDLRLYVAGNNLFYITGYKGVDPNPRYTDTATDLGTYKSPIIPGVDRIDSWARTRSATVGLSVTF